MRNMYYQLWVDAIVNSNDYKNKESGWKFNLYWLMTVINALNIGVLILWLDFFQVDTSKFQINIHSNSVLLSFIGGFINYGLPFAIINYYAIFYKNRYLKLIERYSHYNGRLALSYTFASLLLLIGTVIYMW
ncbi:hypothetical protein DMA11_13895 [Marinilabiliaceae bacterium JC017]|nr:hypothetical protein DMA11_13895 [Marinilabiliaceae bacterium JC017]